MKIQTVADTITAKPEAFGNWDTLKSHNAPFLIEEYYIATQQVSDYETRIAVLDEDQNPIVTALIDVYDDFEEAKLQLAFVAALSDRFRQDATDAQLKELLESYELFVENAQFPKDRFADFDDLRLVTNLMGYLRIGKTPEDFFAAPKATRKYTPTDYSQDRFRAVATEIANKFIAAS